MEPGDVLEIRAAFVVRSGTYDSCAFFDTIPSGTTYIPGTVRVLTNEGKIYKQFTDAVADDEGWIRSSQFVGIHLGYNQASEPARWFRKGRVAYTNRPSFYNRTCIMLASYRVQVTAALNSYILTGGGICTYKTTGPEQVHRFPNNQLLVYTNYGMCSNSVGANALGTEFNGSFGSGKDRNRGNSANVPIGYTYAAFASNAPQDYYYGVPNNTSIRSGYTTSDAWPIPDASHRVFGVWDIIGDHTGAADPYAGNPAADTVANANAGYMLVINAAYRIDSAFQQTISNLCPNTYYEISVWMRNICSHCGCDSTGKGANTTGYIPTALNDSSGVYPNLTFEIDGTDYYTTGNLLYTGKWVIKGFVFRTGPSQNAFTLKLFNNAPGGGGNDWALDDITVATCSPNLTFTPENDPTFCANNPVSIGSTVRSFFNNYTEYKWQRSTDNGGNWNDLSVSGSATPAQKDGAWEYHIAYPSFLGTMADSGHKYRMVVATTPANLSNAGCAFFGNTGVLTLHMDKCALMAGNSVLISGVQQNGYNQVQWTIGQVEKPLSFIIEKYEGGRFVVAGKMPYAGGASFSWREPAGSGEILYRVIMLLPNGTQVISKTVNLQQGRGLRLSLQSSNPIGQQLHLQIGLPQKGTLKLQLTDMQGRMFWSTAQELTAGRHGLQYALPGLPNGMYLLTATTASGTVYQKLVKQNAP